MCTPRILFIQSPETDDFECLLSIEGNKQETCLFGEFCNTCSRELYIQLFRKVSSQFLYVRHDIIHCSDGFDDLDMDLRPNLIGSNCDKYYFCIQFKK